MIPNDHAWENEGVLIYSVGVVFIVAQWQINYTDLQFVCKPYSVLFLTGSQITEMTMACQRTKRKPHVALLFCSF